MSEAKTTLVHLPYTPGTKDYKDSVTAGYYGYAIILTMSVINFMYYGDMFYRRHVIGRFHHWGNMLHSIWGTQAVLRPLVNYMIWVPIGMIASMCIIDSPWLYVLLGNVAGVLAFIYSVRTFFVIMIMVFGIWGDDTNKYTHFTGDTDLFKVQFAWGNEMDLYKYGENLSDIVPASTLELKEVEEFYWMVDLMLEALNILGGAIAYSFFDIGLKIWEPLAKMGIGFIPEDMKEFRKALYLNKLKVYERKFTKQEVTEGDSDHEGHDDHDDEI